MLEDRFAQILRERSNAGTRQHTRPIATACFAEELPMSTMGGYFHIFEDHSARLVGYPLLTIPADHVNMVKFVDKEEDGYIAIRGEIYKWVSQYASSRPLASHQSINTNLNSNLNHTNFYSPAKGSGYANADRLATSQRPGYQPSRHGQPQIAKQQRRFLHSTLSRDPRSQMEFQLHKDDDEHIYAAWEERARDRVYEQNMQITGQILNSLKRSNR